MKTTNCIFVLVLLLCSALSLRKEKDYKSFMNLYNSNNYLRKGALVEAKAMILPKGVIHPHFIQKKEKAMHVPKDILCDDFVQKKEKAMRLPKGVIDPDFIQKKEKFISTIHQKKNLLLFRRKKKLTSISQRLGN